MTPEDIDRLHEEALARGVPAEKLNALRAAALREHGSLEEMAKAATVKEKLAAFRAEMRRSFRPSGS